MEKIKLDVPCFCQCCTEDEYYQCKGCQRHVSYCFGGSDEHWQYCDDCWLYLNQGISPQSLLELIQRRTQNEQI